MPSFYEFSGTLSNMVQSGFIARQLEEGLDSDLAYRRQATEETISGRLGSTITIPKNGRKGPVVAPMNPATMTSNLDNGLTPGMGPVEFYQFVMSEWGDTADVDIIGSLVTAASLVRKAARDNGVQAAMSLERLAKIQVHGVYEGGNTWVRPDLGGQSTATIHVDDIRGFTQIPVNGELLPVTSSNPLPVYEVRTTAGGVNQSFFVTGATADVTNNSLYPGSSVDGNGNTVSDGVSGTLSLSGCTTTPVAGDAIIAANAAKVIRPLNKPSYNLLQSGDAATLGLLLDAMSRLRANNVPTFEDGTYHFIHDPMVMRQLLADQQFLIAYASRFKSEEYQKGQIFELFGITFIPTTEAYVQPANPALGLNVTIRRSIMLGAEALLQGNFEGTDMYLESEPGLDPIGGVNMVNGIAHIVRPPIDRMMRLVSMTWTWIGSFTCPTDATATPLIIPTANNALYKRAVVIQTAG